MSNVRKLSDYRPPLEVVERRVADTDDGFIMLAMELYEELIGANLTRNQAKVAHAVCRKTYGFKKKMDRIADSQLAELCRISRSKANIAKNELIAMGVLVKEGSRIGPNKHISEWHIPECSRIGNIVTKLGTNNVTKPGTSSVTKTEHTKDISKDNKDNTPLTPQGDGIDESKIQECWNEIASKKNYVMSLGLADSIKRHLRRNFTAYLKHCKKIKKDQPKSITEFSCTYLSRGFAGWATGHHSGENDRKWRADIEFAVRKSTFEKIFYSGG